VVVQDLNVEDVMSCFQGIVVQDLNTEGIIIVCDSARFKYKLRGFMVYF
jgi:hypothetical protein